MDSAAGALAGAMAGAMAGAVARLGDCRCVGGWLGVGGKLISSFNKAVL